MGTASWRIAFVAAVGLVLAGCPPWPEKLDSAIPCEDDRERYAATIGPEGGTVPARGTVDQPYAQVEFAAGIFSAPTIITIIPYDGLHGFYLDFPEEPETPSPPFTANFNLDACNTPDRSTYRIATRRRIEPATVRRDEGPREQRAIDFQDAASRPIAPGELDDDRPDEASFPPVPPMPIRGGFVVLSN